MLPAAQNTRVAFQGEPGAFSEDAARAAFTGVIASLPCRGFEDLFAAVKDGRADAGVAPIENTLAGSVLKTYDLLIEHDLVIAGEIVLRIAHNLIAHPGVGLGELRRVYSHPIALLQCERFFKQHPALAEVQAYDTAGSVKDVMARGLREEGAIAGASAAAAYGGAIVAAGIESNPHNFTRFLVLRDPTRVGTLPLCAALQDAGAGRKISIAFRLANRPGGLHQALGVFAEQGLDLTKIESRPIEGRPWEYSFYLDLVGSIEDAKVKRALRELSAMTDFVRVLGSYTTVTAAGVNPAPR